MKVYNSGIILGDETYIPVCKVLELVVLFRVLTANFGKFRCLQAAGVTSWADLESG